MLHGHDLAILRAGRNPQARGQAFFLCRQGMISSHGHFSVHSCKQSALIVDLCNALLSMHQFLCIGDLSAKCFANGLMSQANPKDGNLSRKVFYHFFADSRFRRSSRSGRKNDAVRSKCFDLGDCHLVIADNLYVRRFLSNQLIHVIGKAVIIINDQYHVFSLLNSRRLPPPQGLPLRLPPFAGTLDIPSPVRCQQRSPLPIL